MSNFWTWGNYISWEHCIKASKMCNLENCPDTMNCCATNCIGMPTIKGIVLILSIAIIFLFFFWIFNNLRDANKIIKREERKSKGLNSYNYNNNNVNRSIIF